MVVVHQLAGEKRNGLGVIDLIVVVGLAETVMAVCFEWGLDASHPFAPCWCKMRDIGRRGGISDISRGHRSVWQKQKYI